jgi:hypothetical protein
MVREAKLAPRQGDQHGSRRHLGAPDADPQVKWRGRREVDPRGDPI